MDDYEIGEIVPRMINAKNVYYDIKLRPRKNETKQEYKSMLYQEETVLIRGTDRSLHKVMKVDKDHYDLLDMKADKFLGVNAKSEEELMNYCYHPKDTLVSSYGWGIESDTGGILGVAVYMRY